jgi:hypothetical protein
MLALLSYMTAHGLADLPAQVARKAARQSLVLMVAFGLSIPVFFATTGGWVLWIAGPLLAGAWSRRGQRGEPEPD